MDPQPHVALFVIDGLRPDGLELADTPTLDRLAASGVAARRVRTVMPSVTLPCHVSLFRGVTPGRHGITSNTWTPPARPVPGLIEEIRQAGLHTASFFNWENLRDLSRPGSLDGSFFLDNNHTVDGSGDLELARLAAGWLSANEVHFSFVYLGCTDSAGHAEGWMSPAYLGTIANADRCIAEVLDVLPPDTTVIVTSDHGGHDQSHGTELEEDMIIPLILHGPGLNGGREIEGEVQITDIAPTVLEVLSLERPREWIGRPLQSIL
jgi:predicted AlkP superfamily pyrophosphatase or phosphodiesterase